jgi:uncharacterized protein YxeA
MKKILLLLSLIALIVLGGCKVRKDKKIDPTNITVVSALGSVSYNDSTDWKTDDVFLKREKRLFPSVKFKKRNINGSVKILPAYPNPTDGELLVRIEETDAQLSYVLVDKNFKKISEGKSKASSFTLNIAGCVSGFYRMYYVVQNANLEIIAMGHGDLNRK